MTFKEFEKEVYSAYRVTEDDVYSTKKNTELVMARYAIWWAMCNRLGWRNCVIARKFKRTNASIWHGLKTVEEIRSQLPTLDGLLVKAEKITI